MKHTPKRPTPIKKKRSSQKAASVIVLRGRVFRQSHLRIIAECVKKFFRFGRTRISVEVCRKLRWKQPNGWPKDRACRDVLAYLAQRKLINLPPRLRGGPTETKPLRKRRKRFVYKPIAFSDDISLEFAKGNSAEPEWNALVNRHHYLGHKVVVGRCIKYVIKHKGHTVGAICFSSAAWQLEPRDNVLKRIGFSKERIRERVINNSRFLIVPGAETPNLASRVLSLATRQVAHDWEEFYSVKPEIVETFVQPSRFKGTCYRAANWRQVGNTRGYAKKGRSHLNSQESKYVFLYGLSSRMRRKLNAVQLTDAVAGSSNETTYTHP